jgi:DNA-binding CsgD family transcriptional regulator
MYLSKRTIDYHLRNVFMKLGIARALSSQASSWPTKLR